MPTFDSLMNPLIEALFELGGSGSIDEIYETVIEMQNINDELASVPHNPEKSNLTEIGYRMAWARTYLKEIRISRKLHTWRLGLNASCPRKAQCQT